MEAYLYEPMDNNISIHAEDVEHAILLAAKAEVPIRTVYEPAGGTAPDTQRGNGNGSVPFDPSRHTGCFGALSTGR